MDNRSRFDIAPEQAGEVTQKVIDALKSEGKRILIAYANQFVGNRVLGPFELGPDELRVQILATAYVPETDKLETYVYTSVDENGEPILGGIGASGSKPMYTYMDAGALN